MVDTLYIHLISVRQTTWKNSLARYCKTYKERDAKQQDWNYCSFYSYETDNQGIREAISAGTNLQWKKKGIPKHTLF